MQLIETLSWRYAVKKYSSKKVAEDKVEKILEAINLSASSVGLQPYRVFLIKNPKIREALAEDSFNPQITEASHLIAFAAFDSVTKERIANLVQLMASERGVPESDLEDYKNAVEQGLLPLTDGENFIWSSKQAYLALGTGLIAAADLHVDSTPMEGFNSDKLDELLNLKDLGLKSVVLLALGYRDAGNDFLAGKKKVRLPIDEFATKVL